MQILNIWRPYLKTKYLLIALLAVIGAFSLSMIVYRYTFANSPSIWINQGTIQKTLVAENPSPSSPYLSPDCEHTTQQEIKFKWLGGQLVEDGTRPVTGYCWTNTPWGLYGKGNSKPYFRFGNTGAVTQLWDSGIHFIPIPDSSDMARRANASGSSWFKNLFIYTDLPQSLELWRNGDRNYYKLNNPAIWALRHPTTDQLISMNAFAISNNGKWMVIEGGGEFFRLNVDTKEILPFKQRLLKYGVGQNPTYKLAISNDGRYTIIAGGSVAKRYFLLHDLSACQTDPNNPMAVATGCGERDLKAEVFPELASNQGPDLPRFSDNGYSISYSLNGDYYLLTAPGIQQHLLDYLALGDSYSSGEGDRLGNKYYIPGTDGNGATVFYSGVNGVEYTKEKCHISTRSYPYILASYASLGSQQFKSVACSGAELRHVVDASDSMRGNFEQVTEVQPDLSQIKQQALDEYIPGRTAQIEFLKKYKPRVATIGIGGNNINFADKIAECVQVLADTCRYASANREITAHEMRTLYEDLVAAFKKMVQASPTTRLYAVGYPQVVSQSGQCGLNVRLDNLEREYAIHTIAYLNDTISAAAASAGINFIDIESSLAGSQLCNDQAHDHGVNGVMAGDDMSGPFGIKIIGQESYHPNEKGHRLIAAAIQAALNDSPIDQFNPCAPSQSLSCNTNPADLPAAPMYFATGDTPIKNVAGQFLTAAQDAMDFAPTLALLERGKDVVVDSTLGAFQVMKQATQVEFLLHSTPTPLGTAIVNQDGQVSTTLTIPSSVEPGYHTLHMIATLPSGDKADYYQTVLVVASPTDTDGDGVPNSQDACFFINPTGQDADGDGVDDACDNVVNGPALYRARNGNPTNGEPADSIYIERDIAQAATQLGITGDYDADNDGWAIVAQSDSTTNGTIAHFWVDENNKPFVATRSREKGCFVLTPDSLEQVAENQQRPVATHLENSSQPNLCRAQSPDSDEDTNGQADNSQELYRARNGDPTQGEDTSAIYLERSIFASEARGGVSDYDLNNDGWSLLGKTDALNAGSTYSSLAIPEDPLGVRTGNLALIPKVLAQHPMNGCIALSPEFMTVVQQSQDRFLGMVSLGNLSCN